jgi:uncharacterized protein YecT (DUF1311 family)
MKCALACLLLFATVVPAVAIDGLVPYDVPAAEVDKVYTPDYYDCIGASRAVPATMQDCIVAERQRLQPRLATAYSDAMDRVADGNELGRNQAAWIAQGSEYCEAETSGADDLVRESCLLIETARRIAWLKQL